jgi:hypothetical protein
MFPEFIGSILFVLVMRGAVSVNETHFDDASVGYIALIQEKMTLIQQKAPLFRRVYGLIQRVLPIYRRVDLSQ